MGVDAGVWRSSALPSRPRPVSRPPARPPRCPASGTGPPTPPLPLPIPPQGGPGPLRVTSHMPRFSSDYELVVEAAAGPLPRPRASAALQATSYFHEDGALEAEAVRADVRKLLAKFEAARKKA